MTKLQVKYNAYSTFTIPDKVKLLSVEDNACAKDGAIGSWYIKHNTLFYIDADGSEEFIEGSEPEVECKRPDEVEEIV